MHHTGIKKKAKENRKFVPVFSWYIFAFWKMGKEEENYRGHGLKSSI